MSLRTATPLPVTAEQRAELDRLAASTSSPPRRAAQVRGSLLACDGVASEAIARRCGAAWDTLPRWRFRLADQRITGVGRIAAVRGRKSSLPVGVVEEVLRLTDERPPDGSARRSPRTMAARMGIGKDSVAMICIDHGRRRARGVTEVQRGCRALCPIKIADRARGWRVS